MAILNPDHLLDQAEQLAARSSAGAPRQVDLRRAISAAYYGLFHSTLAAAADQFVGVTKRATSEYALVYRSVNHRSLRELCLEAKKTKISTKYARYAPGGFGGDIQAFATAAHDLQQKRFDADYNPSVRVRVLDASLAISTARSALNRFQAAPETERTAFLSLLVFQPRHA